MADSQQAVLGIKVEAEGTEQAIKQVDALTEQLQSVQDATAAAADVAKKMAADYDRAIKEAADATLLLNDAEKGLFIQNQKLAMSLETAADAIKDLPDLPLANKETADGLKETAEAIDLTAQEMERLQAASDVWSSVEDALDGLTGSLRDYAQAALDAYKPLDQARQQLKTFVDNADEAEQAIKDITAAAANWGQDKTDLTAAAAALAEAQLDVQGNLESIVKLAAANGKAIGETAGVFVKAAQGDAAALKTLKEDYNLATYQIKNYGIAVDSAGRIAADTADRQQKLAAALSDIAKVQYGNAIAEQQDTLAGSIERLETTIDNAKSALGESVAPIIQRLTDYLSDAVNQFNLLPTEAQRGITSLAVFTGSLTVAAAALAKVVVTAGQAFTAVSSWLTLLTKTATEVGHVAAATTQAASSTASFAAKAASAAAPLGSLLALYEAIAIELAQMYQKEQEAKGLQLTQESRVDTAYAHALRDINAELGKIGLSFKDIGDAAKQSKIVEYLGDSKKAAIDLKGALDAVNAKIEQNEKAIKSETAELERREKAAKAYQESNAGSSSWYGNLDYYNAKISSEGVFGYGAVGVSDAYTQQAIDKDKELLEIGKAQQELTKNQAETLQKAIEWKTQEAERTKRILEHEKELTRQKQEQAAQDKERAAGIKEALGQQLEKARDLEPTDAGVKKAQELLSAYKQIGEQNSFFVIQQKDLEKSYQQGLNALTKQAEKLEKARAAAEQKAEAEKVFAQQAEKHEALQDKSLTEQRDGLNDILAAYKDLLATDDAFLSNAENRKKAEAEMKRLAEERLGIEEKIVDLERTAAEKLHSAQMKAMEQQAERYEAAARHADKIGKTAEAEAYNKKAAEQRQKIEDARYQDAQKEITAKYAPLLAQAEGTDAYNQLVAAHNQEQKNLLNQRTAQQQQTAWAAEEQKVKAENQQRDQAAQARAAETQQINRGAAAADRLAMSMDRAAAAADRSAASMAKTAGGNIVKAYGVEAKVQNGTPVEILSSDAQQQIGQPWAQRIYEQRRAAWDAVQWQPSVDAIRQQQAVMTQGAFVPSYDTPIPKSQVGKTYQQTTYNLQVNGQTAAGVGSVDYQQMIDAGVRMATAAVTSKINQQLAANSLY